VISLRWAAVWGVERNGVMSVPMGRLDVPALAGSPPLPHPKRRTKTTKGIRLRNIPALG
jgi:hypothetical protein